MDGLQMNVPLREPHLELPNEDAPPPYARKAPRLRSISASATQNPRVEIPVGIVRPPVPDPASPTPSSSTPTPTSAWERPHPPITTVQRRNSSGYQRSGSRSGNVSTRLNELQIVSRPDPSSSPVNPNRASLNRSLRNALHDTSAPSGSETQDTSGSDPGQEVQSGSPPSTSLSRKKSFKNFFGKFRPRGQRSDSASSANREQPQFGSPRSDSAIATEDDSEEEQDEQSGPHRMEYSSRGHSGRPGGSTRRGSASQETRENVPRPSLANARKSQDNGRESRPRGISSHRGARDRATSSSSRPPADVLHHEGHRSPSADNSRSSLPELSMERSSHEALYEEVKNPSIIYVSTDELPPPNFRYIKENEHHMRVTQEIIRTKVIDEWTPAIVGDFDMGHDSLVEEVPVWIRGFSKLHENNLPTVNGHPSFAKIQRDRIGDVDRHTQGIVEDRWRPILQSECLLGYLVLAAPVRSIMVPPKIHNQIWRMLQDWVNEKDLPRLSVRKLNRLRKIEYHRRRDPETIVNFPHLSQQVASATMLKDEEKLEVDEKLREYREWILPYLKVVILDDELEYREIYLPDEVPSRSHSAHRVRSPNLAPVRSPRDVSDDFNFWKAEGENEPWQGGFQREGVHNSRDSQSNINEQWGSLSSGGSSEERDLGKTVFTPLKRTKNWKRGF